MCLYPASAVDEGLERLVTEGDQGKGINTGSRQTHHIAREFCTLYKPDYMLQAPSVAATSKVD